MGHKLANGVLIALVIVAFAAGALAYPALPEEIASHWNAQGTADDYMPKAWGTFLLPGVALLLYALYRVIPALDPLRRNIESFRKYYDSLWLLIIGFMLYVYALQLLWNFGVMFSFTVAIVPAIALLWYFLGTAIEHSKRNWFVGIRTPWTLSSDLVWEKTHRLGGTLFKIAGVIALGGLFFRDSGAIIGFIAVPAFAIAIITIVYSFLEYRKIKA